MKKSISKVRSVCTAIAAALALGMTLPASATIPVFDIAANPQLILNYVRQGMQYVEELNQGVNITEQLRTQVIEYRDFLINLKNLPADVKAILRTGIMDEISRVKSYYTNGPAGATILLDPKSTTYVRDLEAVLSSLYTPPMDSAAVTSMLNATARSPDPAAVQTVYSQTRARYENVANSMRNVLAEQRGSEQRQAIIARLYDNLDSLGDLSQLEATQLLARNTALLNAQTEASIKLQNINNLERYYETMDQISAQAKSRQIQIDRVTRASNTTLTAPFGPIPR